MKRGAIFDMDGTLLDTERLYTLAWLETAADFGKEPEPDIAKRACGLSNDKCVALVKEYYPDLDGEEYLEHVVNFVRKKVETDLSLMPGVPEILDFFQDKGIPMAIASSTDTERIESYLGRAGIRKYFSVIVGGEQVAKGKPNPDIFLRAAELLNLPASDCYVFEDSPNGVRAGAAAGCAVIMVPDSIQPDDELRGMCEHVFESMFVAMERIG